MNEVITKSAIFELLAFAEDNNVIEKAKDALDAALSGSLSLSFELRNLVFAINAADDTKAEKMKLAYSAVFLFFFHSLSPSSFFFHPICFSLFLRNRILNRFKFLQQTNK